MAEHDELIGAADLHALAALGGAPTAEPPRGTLRKVAFEDGGAMAAECGVDVEGNLAKLGARVFGDITTNEQATTTAVVPVADLFADEPAPAAPPRQAKRRRQRALVRSITEIRALPPQRWFVHHLIPQIGVGLLVGPPNVGKTAIALDWVLRALCGQNWFGRRVARGSVIYFASEGVIGLGKRVGAALQQNGVEIPADRYMDVVTGLPPLSTPEGRRELRAVVEDAVARHGHPPAAVVIDTLSGHWAESEDKSEFAAPAMAEMQAIAAEFGLAIILLHHERKPQAGGSSGGWAAVRGSGAWVGSADSVWSVASTADGLEIHTTKQRDAERGPVILAKLVPVTIGADEEGATITAITVAPRTGTAAAAVEDEERTLADDVVRLVEALKKLGTATSRSSIISQARIKKGRGLAAFDAAVDRGLIVNEGSDKRQRFRLRGGGALPIPLGNREPGFPVVPVAVPGTTREPGTVAHQAAQGVQP